jgi:DNA repair protein RadC
VKEWPATEQPREKLVQLGPEHLSEAELLAILLRAGVKGQDVLSLAQHVLRHHGGLLALSRAPLIHLMETKGIGEAKATTIQAALELGRRLILTEARDALQVRSPQDVASLLQIEMGPLQQEHLKVVLLDTKNHVQGIREVYKGSVNTSQIRTAEVFRDAVKENCPAIVVAHNHPSGDPTPSPEDVRVTRELVSAGRLLDIELLDHLVIGRNRYVSLRQKKLGFD